tara:strand:- start:1076 stop:1465 length:390 start_codon:yes stop_codon:yes gene_type:complete
MNIYGIGTDIVNINRIKNAFKKNSNSFKKRIYTNFEIKRCERRKNKIECFAKRFAAKEALIKAIGSSKKLKFNEIEIKNNSLGAPKIFIKGLSLINFKKNLKKRKFKIHLSLSDDKPWAVASVIIFTYK